MTELRDQTKGARPMGAFDALPPPVAMVEAAAKPPQVKTDERCSDCIWPEVCGKDQTCWDENKRLRKDWEQRVRVVRELADVIDLGAARDDRQAEGVLNLLRDGLAAGVEIVLRAEPPEHAKRLLATLGATYRVDARAKAPAAAEPRREVEAEREEISVGAKCKMPGCDREALSTRGRYANLCEVHKDGVVAGAVAAPSSPPADPEPELEEKPATNGSGTHVDRVRVVLDAAQRLDQAEEEVTAARQSYTAAVKALATA